MNKAWYISNYPHFDAPTWHANIISPHLLCRSYVFPRESNDFRAPGSSLTSSYYMLRSYFRATRECLIRILEMVHVIIRFSNKASPRWNFDWKIGAHSVFLSSSFHPLFIHCWRHQEHAVLCNREYFQLSLEYVRVGK